MRQRMTLAPLPFRPDIALYRPHAQSGLHAWLAEMGREDAPPYWAYAWAGGAALALHLQDHAALVSGRTVLDFGAGSGLVGIAAAKAGAMVTAFEPDAIGQCATRLNARANHVAIAVVDEIIDCDMALAGDVFYDDVVATQTLAVLRALAERGATVLIGDPFRNALPFHALEQIAEYLVPDMGSPELVRAGVFTLRP